MVILRFFLKELLLLKSLPILPWISNCINIFSSQKSHINSRCDQITDEGIEKLKEGLKDLPVLNNVLLNFLWYIFGVLLKISFPK